MSNDLIERVARAICEIENGPCECMPDECGCTYWKAHARAAIALALEEAAKVADAYEPRCDVCPRGVAAAIRALKGTK